MNQKQNLHGMSTVSFWADDVKAASEWYAELLGIEPYFVRPSAEAPEYAEFRVGDYQHELGIISNKYRPDKASKTPGGAVLYWHVDNVKAMLAILKDKGAAEYQPLIEREAGFVTAAVVDPFGNIIGLMYSPHYISVFKEGINAKKNI